MLLATTPYPRIDPDALRFGPLHVRWYGLAYLLGFALAFAALRRMSRKGMLRIPADAVGDLVSWLALGVMLGGRIGWWSFYHRSEGAIEPWYEPLAIWHGGMSFHGGLIGVLAALLIWSWRRRTPFWNLADCLALVAPLGLFFGRIANFVDAELVGRHTSVPWGMIFPGEFVPRHPSQLYEAALEGPVLLLVLWIIFRARRPIDGQTAALFLICYDLFRFAVEFTRQPDRQLGFIAFGWLTMGELLSAVLAVVGIVLWLIRRRSLVPDTADNGYGSCPSPLVETRQESMAVDVPHTGIWCAIFRRCRSGIAGCSCGISTGRSRARGIIKEGVAAHRRDARAGCKRMSHIREGEPPGEPKITHNRGSAGASPFRTHRPGVAVRR